LAESVNASYKTELIRRRGPWRTVDDVEFATLEYVWWYNHQRLHEALGYMPPAEYETTLIDISQPSESATPALVTAYEQNLGYFNVRQERRHGSGHL
ncbi:transposase, partial [Rhodococcus sp. BP-252]|nr:transposase [Rhodococcus sp. BP-320]MBY6419501.1 transposase [Rhodococcus sp. BP-321]MBY6424487.1 transposase [Rhodococcus sp. BP-324]MBY6429512.1 transposase [Rhodococcus sp. BP-323]MBY6434497.1 transposase [Rhodococcus sp. BP-322]MBY6443340.1 transposase [Rhodococcus sp. BP-319]MBY6448167.1 transposase [Rhodococcus sp. BP-318]MBY6453053.1 transposase [Rhodococcus sp. BP-315]MBY6457770.1 transposase [Rhodococcus sp. BP-277]MBY6462763.1 transposase [Rhodococcus sp. BP-260]MBY6467581.1 